MDLHTLYMSLFRYYIVPDKYIQYHVLKKKKEKPKELKMLGILIFSIHIEYVFEFISPYPTNMHNLNNDNTIKNWNNNNTT